jgi:hypothetical protein
MPHTGNRAGAARFTAPVELVNAEFAAATEAWRWRMPATAEPLLITALGDVFVRLPDGRIHFLDTESGELVSVANSVAAWQQMLQDPKRVQHWFRPDFVAQLERAHSTLKSPHVYSPTIPLVLGGKLTVTNYTPSRWDAHLHVLGQIHQQVKDLPLGTPITKIHVEPW